MKNIHTYLLSVISIAVLFACDPKEDRLSMGDAITVDQLNITATPIVVNGKNSNKIVLENHSPVLSSWNFGVGVSQKAIDTVLMVVEGENQIIFTGLNADGTIIEKKVSVNIDELTFPVPLEWGFLTGGTEKTWSWNSELPAVWGNGGYLIHREPTWWPVPLSDINETSGIVQEGAGAVMTFVLQDAKLIKVKANGETLTGAFTFDMSKKIMLGDGSVWAKGILTTKGVSLLGGYSPNENISVYEYEILTLDGEQMILCHPEAGAGEWGTAWYWMFQAQ